MSGYGDSEQSGNEYHELHKQCDSLLQYIDFKDEPNREWVAKSYRKLTQFLTLSAMSYHLPQLATKYAYQIRPFSYDQGIQHRTKQMEQFYAAKKKCQVPLIYKSQKNQFKLLSPQNGYILIKENNKFNLKIEGQEKSDIFITYDAGHPLRTKPDLVFKHYEKANLQINPPCVLTICVTKQTTYAQTTQQNIIVQTTVPFKLPSNVIKIEVVNKGGNKKGGGGMGLLENMDNIVIRPQETCENLYSNSGNSQVYHYVGIEGESRSRD